MVEYKCDRCNVLFNKKYHYERHINRKYPCKIDNQNHLEFINKVSKGVKKLPNGTEKSPDDTKKRDNNFIQNKNLYNNDNQCKYCNKNFTKPSSLQRHLNSRCKIKMKNEDEKENLLQKLIEDMGKQKEELKQTQEKVTAFKEEIKKKDTHVANLEIEFEN